MTAASQMRRAIDPEEMPTADAIATAVVAAARTTGEDPRLLYGPGNRLRAAFAAYAALQIFYPEYPASRLGKRLGLTSAPYPLVKGAQASKWWPTVGVPAWQAASEALERI